MYSVPHLKNGIFSMPEKSRQEPQTLITSMVSPVSCSPSTGFPSCCFRIAASNRFPQMPKPCTVSCWTAWACQPGMVGWTKLGGGTQPVYEAERRPHLFCAGFSGREHCPGAKHETVSACYNGVSFWVGLSVCLLKFMLWLCIHECGAKDLWQ